MEKNVITLCDDNGFEIVAQYIIEHVQSQIEEGHGYHEVGDYDYIQLYQLDIIFCQQPITITHKLTSKQRHQIEHLILETIKN
jgi:hypothetical protein